jgi:glutamate-1-semialdehyde aminotransferase
LLADDAHGHRRQPFRAAAGARRDAAPRVVVFNWCYHGTVDEAFATLGPDGTTCARPGNMGPACDPAQTTRVVEFNDVPGLEAALAPRDVACVLAEPAMTNIGIIHPEPGYLDALRELTRRTGTLLILDETHTICAGPAGMTGELGLAPDMLVLGKPLAGGVPAAVVDADLDRHMHLAALNRGILMTPFHNMALIVPDATEADMDRHAAVFRESVEALTG